MMAPPNTFAPAAVSPSSRLVRMGDMRKKNSRKHGPAVSCPFPITCEELHTGTTPGKSAFRIRARLQACRKYGVMKAPSGAEESAQICHCREYGNLASYNPLWLKADS